MTGRYCRSRQVSDNVKVLLTEFCCSVDTAESVPVEVHARQVRQPRQVDDVTGLLGKTPGKFAAELELSEHAILLMKNGTD